MKRALVLSGIVVLACLTRSAGVRGAENDAIEDRVRRGIVLVEQHGDAIAIGTVLGHDGRVLTALSALSGAVVVDLRYADGSIAHAQVARSDRASDLALLIPQFPAWTEGLDASDIDPGGAELRVMLPSRGGQLGAIPATVHGDVAAHGEKGQPTVRMLGVGIKARALAGAPLLDSRGRVVAVLVHACKVIPMFAPASASTMQGGEQLPLPPPPCVPELLGAPVAAIRFFLTGEAARR